VDKLDQSLIVLMNYAEANENRLCGLASCTVLFTRRCPPVVRLHCFVVRFHKNSTIGSLNGLGTARWRCFIFSRHTYGYFSVQEQFSQLLFIVVGRRPLLPSEQSSPHLISSKNETPSRFGYHDPR